MFKRNEKQYPLLVPYLEGDLDDARASDLRARLAEDPALAAEAERLRRTLDAVRETSRRSPAPETASPPADLWPRLRDRLEPAPAPRRLAPAGWLAAAGAAATVAFAAIWLPGHHTPPQTSRGTKSGPKIAHASTPASPAAKRPQQMASASVPGSEASHPVFYAAPPSASVKPSVPVLAAGGGSVTYATPPAPAKLALPAPALSRHDPFASGKVASLDGASRVPVFSAPPTVPVPAASKPVSVFRKGPTQMASRDTPRATGDGVAETSTYASPVPSAADSFAVPAPPAPPAAPAPLVMAPVPTPTPGHAMPPAASAAGAAMQTKNGAVARNEVRLDADVVRGRNLQDGAGRGFGGGTLGSAAARPKAFALSPQPGRGYYNARQQRTVPSQSAAKPSTQQQNGFSVFDLSGGQTLDTWQAALALAEQPPLLGQDAGTQQASQALMSARETGALDTLRQRLEARRTQSPRDLVTARMLAAVYDFGFSADAALRERRRLVTLEGATGEDWFALAEAEVHVGNGQAARAAYRRALDAPLPLSPFHALLARGRG